MPRQDEVQPSLDQRGYIQGKFLLGPSQNKESTSNAGKGLIKKIFVHWTNN